MLRYLRLAVLILSILGSQVGIAVIVAEWRTDETEIVEVAEPQTTPRPLTTCERLEGNLVSAQTESAAKVIAFEMEKLDCIAVAPFDLRRIEVDR